MKQKRAHILSDMLIKPEILTDILVVGTTEELLDRKVAAPV
jgi:hypothetical protein